MNPKKCQDCNTEYTDQDAKRFGHCPNCDSGFFTLTSLHEAPSRAPQKSTKKESRQSFSLNAMDAPGFADVEKLIQAQQEVTRSLVTAQNQTTHAVRSLAITFVAAPVIAIAILFVITLSVISGSTTFIVFTAVAAIIISIGVLVAALTELRRSRVY